MNSKSALFKLRAWMYYNLFHMHFRINRGFNFLRPGLEVKYACEAANETGADIEFAGPELNRQSMHRL